LKKQYFFMMIYKKTYKKSLLPVFLLK